MNKVASRATMYSRTLNTSLALICLFIVGLILFGTRLGFDTSDEAWVFSLIDSRRDTYAEPWAYHYILHPIWTLLGEKVLLFRILRLIGYVAAAIFLASAGERFAKAFVPEFPVTKYRFLLFTSAISGAGWAWIYSPQTLAYNEMSGIVGVIVVALMMRLAAETNSSITFKTLILVGFALVFIMPFKYPSTFALTLLVVVTVLLLNSLVGRRGKALASIGAGAALGFVFLVVINLPFATWIGTIVDLFVDEELQAAFAHPIGPLLRTNISDLLQASRFAFLYSVLPLILIGVVHYYLSKKSKLSSYAVIVFSGVVVTFIGFSYYSILVYPNLSHQYLILKGVSGFIGFTALALYNFVIANCVQKEKLRDAQIIGLLIFASPLALAFGTNNPILGQVNYSIAPWLWLYALSFGMLLFKFPSVVTNLVSGFYVSLALLSTAALVYIGVLVGPYRGVPASMNNTASNVPELSGLLMTESLAKQLDWINAKGSTSEFANQPTIAISSPGLLFNFNNSDFASPFVIDGWPISYISIDHACGENGTAPVILKDATIPFPDMLLPALASCGITTMDQYELVDQHIGSSGNADAQIWVVRTS